MVVVSHLFLFLRNKFRGRQDSCESCLPLFRTVYFQTAPFIVPLKDRPSRKENVVAVQV